jgi:regulator of sirC expression with transglutaminase-like and TPR domain
MSIASQRVTVFSMLALCIASFAPAGLLADEAKPEATSERETGTRKSVEDVYQRARPSLAVITVGGRDGRKHGLGSGFVVSADGLIATNLHVIGEGRPITVQMADGKRHDVTSVHASDRFLDLAILRVDATGLTPLKLADSEFLRPGQAVVALGNPMGLRHSVVAGVVSGQREIDGRKMIQLAIAVEPGNSGGPLVDMQGHVGGILTLKSLVTNNLGFAVGINDLKPLLARPNPVPIDRWVKQGALDAAEWTPVFGANWHARGARVLVDGEGDGFGGRSLCLSSQAPPDVPFELTATVRLDDEAGAAGLVFGADGGDKHYGFYPTAGTMRLTRFDGPDVLNWTILAQQASPFYKAGEWNTLHVRVEPQRIVCRVNGHEVITTHVSAALTGKVGLAKFRDTHAEFKGFRVGRELTAPAPSAEAVARIDRLLDEMPADSHPGIALAEQLAENSAVTTAALTDRAEALSHQAEQLRRLSDSLRQVHAHAELLKVLDQPEESIDLLAAALAIARLDNDEIDVESYRRQLDRMAADVMAKSGEMPDEAARFSALNNFFFDESGFHGSRGDYYHRANSYVNEVLDDREGLPITLSIVYMELARRLSLHVEGVGLPGHFVVRYVPTGGESRLIDVFDGGQVVSPEEAGRRVLAATRAPLTEEQQKATTKRAIVVRILYNLKEVAGMSGDNRAVLRYLDALLAISPEAHRARFDRAMLRSQNGDRAGAVADADWLLEHPAEGLDRGALQDFRAFLDRAAK